MSDDTTRIPLSSLYQQLDSHATDDDPQYDASAGLARLKAWMSESVDESSTAGDTDVDGRRSRTTGERTRSPLALSALNADRASRANVTDDHLAQPIADEDTPTFVISVAAQLAGLHAQTLRSYDRMGLVSPSRTSSGGRRYSMRDIALLREVQRLSQDEGVNLAGIKRIIELERKTDTLRAQLAQVTNELAATEQAAAAIRASYGNELLPNRR